MLKKSLISVAVYAALTTSAFASEVDSNLSISSYAETNINLD